MAASAFLVFLFGATVVLAQNNTNENECGRLLEDSPGLLPWHALIYRKTEKPYKYLCGGTLINAKTILAAAHCVSKSTSGTVEPASTYAVALGQKDIKWDGPELAQKVDVSKIAVPATFLGYPANYQSDIAVLTLSEPITFNGYIHPVCLSLDGALEATLLKSGNIGKVVAHPSGEKGPRAPVDMSYLPIEECLKELPSQFRQFITTDKMCASFKSPACPGYNSGTSLSFPVEEKGVTRYYAQGLLSVGLESSDEACRIKSPLAFTKLSSHAAFIKANL